MDGRSRRTWHALAELEEGEGNWQRAEEFRLLAAAGAEAATPAPPSQGLRFLQQAESAGSSLGPVVRDFVERWQAALDDTPQPGQPPSGQQPGGGGGKALALNTR